MDQKSYGSLHPVTFLLEANSLIRESFGHLLKGVPLVPGLPTLLVTSGPTKMGLLHKD